MQNKTREFTPIQGQEIIQTELGLFEFAHLSFQEYLAAAQIKELQQENILFENFQDPWWAETIRLYIAQSDATHLIQKAIENPTIYTLSLALDCEEQSLKVDLATRQQLDTMLEQGLESPDPKIATLAAEVKLWRRINNLLAIDEDLEIDTIYITRAEYQLFVDQWLNSEEHFPSGTAKQPITQVSWYNAMRFCAWLSAKALSLTQAHSTDTTVFYYRLPTLTETENYCAREDANLGCWTLRDSDSQDKGIRVVKTKIPPSVFEFDVITVNSQGQEIKRQRSAAPYETENLGNNIALAMVYIPGGTFMMGSPKNEQDSSNSERPQHQVTVPPFFMGKYPVTQGQWKAIASRTDLKVKIDLEPNPSRFKRDDRPVERVNWDEAVEFCQRLTKLTEKNYQLASEAQWEYACRGGTNTPFHFGATITKALANYNAQQTTSVGQFPPNTFGLYDIHGNVWEWCADDWHKDYQGAPTDGSAWIDKKKQKGSDSVVRGGSWLDYPNYCRSAIRNYYSRRDYRDYALGFRVVCVFERSNFLG
ncbi:SUMF1/EgtB/PvdO family nonheme iron enzyme [Crocosphaera sp. UHCC 0190]|uniref:formylglycine-generating enzyme family protein n=1 Tax=Crocosphaera sp. UHCC 0190 TaxID=3110246 RepID=UPI002B2147C8|nr:SUMF1/EgtB/PvdO family nonheme iron enzyme [Crocosphaera sp. UHCC 0190]MEA5508344.1 SUMF1/EgtB/PvdO family nonheme iron enzyme [Crocosphaera sp. UHCC 0190]